MLKKIIWLLVALLVISSVSYGQSSYIDTTLANSGKITITHSSIKPLAVIVAKGNSQQQYILNTHNKSVPLPMGNGAYTIHVLENVSGTTYKQISKETINVKLTNPNSVYLQSIQMVNFDSTMKSVAKAAQLTKNATTDKQKVELIYNYIVQNIQYDHTKAKSIVGNYIPTIDNTLASNLGICYDYASLFAAMLRSQNIPTKLVMGTTPAIADYHAWNEVLLDGTWVTIDTTFDAGMLGFATTTMIKNATNYVAENAY